MRPITQRLIQAFGLDVVPDMAVCVDFGIPPYGDPNPVYGALQWGYLNENFTAQELDFALGSGKLLTELVGRKNSRGDINPYLCIIETAYDCMEEE